MFSRLFRNRIIQKRNNVRNKTYMTSRLTNPKNPPSYLNNIQFGKDIFVSVNSYDVNNNVKAVAVDTDSIPGFKNINIDETDDKINITFITDQESQFNHFRKLLKEKDEKIYDKENSEIWYAIITFMITAIIFSCAMDH